VSDLLTRAGGLTPEAYSEGVQFYRSYTAGRLTGGDPMSPLLATPRPYVSPSGRELAGRDSVRRSVPERVGIDLPRVLKDSSFRDNIVLMGGDSIYIPEFDPVVMVRGAVNSPGAVAYEPGMNLDWYVDRAGGYTQTGDNDRPFVTQPNGEREGVKRRTILADRVPHPKPGSVVYVPAKVIREDRTTAAAILGTVAQVLGLVTTIIVVATR
jgi:protein involved in polysaccharide export with SLBB domain